MAFAFKRRGKWYLAWKEAGGRWKRRATTAVSEREADRLAREKERKVERQVLGLDPLPSDLTSTVSDLCEWWLRERCPPAGRYDEGIRLTKHVMAQPLGELQLSSPGLSAALAQRLIDAERKDGLAPASVNRLRAILSSMFTQAEKADRWLGGNPIDRIESRRVPKRTYTLLRPEEVDPVLACVPLIWRGATATAIFLGLRKGEILSLQKGDVDQRARLVTVGRSWERDTTKGGHSDVLPIPKALLPHLEAALQLYTGPLVFPWEDGRPRTRESDPHLVLRRAAGRAGVVTGWRYPCRRCVRRAREAGQERPEPETRAPQDRAPGRACPACGMKLWEQPIPKPIRFHDLRHSLATILLARGEPAALVSRILRHASVATTTSIYGHLVAEDLRASVEGLTTQKER